MLCESTEYRGVGEDGSGKNEGNGSGDVVIRDLEIGM